MKSNNVVFNSGRFNQAIIAIFAFTLPITAAFAGTCCSGHGGVSGICTNGYQQCKDKTMSPSCKCTAPAAKKTSIKSTTTTTKTTKSKGVIPTSKSVIPTTSKSTTGTKGCCSSHGGIASCNTSTGSQMCKDGTTSPTCKCH